MLKSLLQTVIFAAVAITAVVGLFIAWWIAVCAVLCFAAYLGIRRFLAGKGLVQDAGHASHAGHGPVVIEGQYEVEPEPQPGRPSRPQDPGRVIDVTPDRH